MSMKNLLFFCVAELTVDLLLSAEIVLVSLPLPLHVVPRLPGRHPRVYELGDHVPVAGLRRAEAHQALSLQGLDASRKLRVLLDPGQEPPLIAVEHGGSLALPL